MRRAPAIRVVLAAVAVLAAALAGCSRSRPATLPPEEVAEQTTLYTIGDAATEGDGVHHRLYRAWPYLVLRDLPTSTVLVNGADDDVVTAARALEVQLPLARELRPESVAIWLGAEDVRFATPVAEFEATMRELIAGARAAGAERIAVGDLPVTYGDDVRAYNDAIRRAVAAEAAELVELEDAAVTLRQRDFAALPDRAGHTVVAEAFGRALA